MLKARGGPSRAEERRCAGAAGEEWPREPTEVSGQDERTEAISCHCFQ